MKTPTPGHARVALQTTPRTPADAAGRPLAALPDASNGADGRAASISHARSRSGIPPPAS